MATSDNPHEVEHLRDRVRLYVQVMLSIDVFAYVSDLVMPLILDNPVAPGWSTKTQVLRYFVTGELAAVWAFAKFAKPGRLTLIALESAVTISLVLIYTYIALGMQGASAVYGPMFGMFGISLLLVVRASLVPSPVIRTVVIGVSSVACLLAFAYRTNAWLDSAAVDGVSFIGGAFVLATGVTSHVIYGLRNQVRRAMRLGQYELGRKLGEGGMGVVYKATHVLLRRPTAIKLLRPDKVGAQTVARFEREVQQTSRLEHPNSVHIYDYGHTPDGQFYYAMEYVDGLTLEQLVAEHGPVNAARAVMILRQAARALAEAHALGLVHRDVKPANIMLCERAQVPDTVKVLDFGLVKEIDTPGADPNITQTTSIIGTPQYLAPESILSPDDVGPPSDVYALGAIGFFLVTGRDVFPSDSVVQVCSQHLTATPESPSRVLGSEIDVDFEALLLRCLSKEPGDRPRDGAAFADELDQLSLPNWSVGDARAWWRAHPLQRAVTAKEAGSERTQLNVDFELGR